MKDLFAFLHMAGDTALWLTWGSLILGLFTGISDCLLAVPLFGLCGLAANRLSKRRKWLGWLGLLPALAVLFLYPAKGDRLLLLPPLVYLALSIRKGATEPDPTELYYRFHVVVGAAMAGAILCIAASRGWGFSCGLLSMTSQVFLMRMLRHSEQELKNIRLMALEVFLLLLLYSAAMLMCSDAFLSGSLAVLKWLYQTFLSPLLMLAVYLLLAVLWCFDWLLSRLLDLGPVGYPGDPISQIMEQAQEYLPAEEVTLNPWLVILVRVAGIALFFGLAWLVFRYLRKGGGVWQGREEPDQDPRTAVSIPEERISSRPRLLDRSPAARVRRAYQAYCRDLTKRGIVISPADTTRSVNHLADLDSNADAAELRQLYLLARYSGGDRLSAEDARRAGQLSRQLRGQSG